MVTVVTGAESAFLSVRFRVSITVECYKVLAVIVLAEERCLSTKIVD